MIHRLLFRGWLVLPLVLALVGCASSGRNAPARSAEHASASRPESESPTPDSPSADPRDPGERVEGESRTGRSDPDPPEVASEPSFELSDEVRETIAEFSNPSTPRVRVSVDQRTILGPNDAPLTIVLVEDFQCPFCAQAAETLEQVRELYRERARFALIQMPLRYHEHALDAAILLEQAGARLGADAYWAAYQLLFANRDRLDRDALLEYGERLGLDPEELNRAFVTNPYQSKLNADIELARRIGLNAIPTLFINGRVISGTPSLRELRIILDHELALSARLIELGVEPSRLYDVLMQESAPALPRRPRRAARPRLDPGAIYDVPLGNAPRLGPDDALITIVIFSDFECPFCARVLPTLNRLQTAYGVRLRLVFRHSPLPFHRSAIPAAEAAIEAFEQRGHDAFWQMHNRLFSDASMLDREGLEAHAQALELDMDRFRTALDQHRHISFIDEDLDLADSLGVRGTPTFFINGRMLRGAQPFSAFVEIIDEELPRAEAALESGTPPARLYEALIRDGARAPVYR